MSGIKRTAEDIRVSKEVRERDGWTCQRCGREYERGDGRLQAAHCFTRAIKRMGLRVDKDNLLSLCFGCHQFVDSHDGEKETLWRLRIGNERYDRIAAIAHQKRDRV
jgi:5-methylcytosine-specific restriction endonuclease McrA